MRDSRHTQRPWNLPPWLEGVHVYSAILGALSAVVLLGVFSSLIYAVVAPPARIDDPEPEPVQGQVGPAPSTVPEQEQEQEPEPTATVAAVPRPGVPRRGRRGRVDNDERHISSAVGPPPPDVLEQLQLAGDPPPAPAADSVVARRTAPAPRPAPRPRPRPRRKAAPAPVPAPAPAPAPANTAASAPTDSPARSTASSAVVTPEPAPTPLPEAGTLGDEPVTTVIVGAQGEESTLPEPEPVVDTPAASGPPVFEPSPEGRVYVRVSSSPVGAEIRLDGRFRGRTPAKITLDPGTYELVLTLDGARTKLKVDADDDVRLCFAQHGTSLAQVSCSQLR